MELRQHLPHLFDVSGSCAHGFPFKHRLRYLITFHIRVVEELGDPGSHILSDVLQCDKAFAEKANLRGGLMDVFEPKENIDCAEACDVPVDGTYEKPFVGSVSQKVIMRDGLLLGANKHITQ